MIPLWNVNSLCLGCFQEKGDLPVCPYCGYAENTPQHSALCLPAGTVLNGRYLLGRTLGQGGFGITYLGFDLNTGIKAAIKEYMPDGMATRSNGNTQVSVYSQINSDDFQYGINKFLEEAKILAKFSSNPYIVSVYSFFLENGTAYFVMEYVDGMTLKDYLIAKGRVLSYQETVGIMTPVMLALDAVHKEKLLHRDISPDNIFITKAGMVKLLDFGAARYNMGEHSKSLSVILKPGYAPEEQYRSHGNQGPWTDIYALGATFYLCLTGVIPPVSLDRLQNDEIIPLSKTTAVLPGGVDFVLMKALAVRAQYRWQTIAEFMQALQNPQSARNYAAVPQYQPSATAQRPFQQQQAVFPPQPAVGQQPPHYQSPAAARKKNKTAAVLLILFIPAVIILIAAVVAANQSHYSHTASSAARTEGFQKGSIESNAYVNLWSDIALELPSTWRFLSSDEMDKAFNDPDLVDFCAAENGSDSYISLSYVPVGRFEGSGLTPAQYVNQLMDDETETKADTSENLTFGGYSYYTQETVASKSNSNQYNYYLIRQKGDYLVLIYISTQSKDTDSINRVLSAIHQAS